MPTPIYNLFCSEFDRESVVGRGDHVPGIHNNNQSSSLSSPNIPGWIPSILSRLSSSVLYRLLSLGTFFKTPHWKLKVAGFTPLYGTALQSGDICTKSLVPFLVREMEEVTGIMDSMADKNLSQDRKREQLLERWKYVLDLYQEQPHLLDPHLPTILGTQR